MIPTKTASRRFWDVSAKPIGWGSWSGVTEYADFRQGALVPERERFFVQPPPSRGAARCRMFVTARAGVHYRQYDLDQTNTALLTENASRRHRAASRASTADGLRARRPDFGHRHRQTPSARIYVYIPFRKQDQTPIFDTESTISVFPAFLEIGTSATIASVTPTQLNAGADLALIDPATGAERLRLAIGSVSISPTSA